MRSGDGGHRLVCWIMKQLVHLIAQINKLYIIEFELSTRVHPGLISYPTPFVLT